MPSNKPKLESLLINGYFPKELPPCFSTTSFANFAVKNTNSICDVGSKWTQPVSYNLIRPGGTRRVLSIPNPLSYTRLSRTLLEEWPKLNRVLKKSKLSKSSPRLGLERERAIEPKHALSELFTSRLNLRAEAGFLVRADVLEFYRSIYTHSVPWAIIGKPSAKSLIGKKHKKEWHNRLDECLRNGRNGQTIGIDIGPDTSFIVAETILSSVDAKLSRRLKNINGFRYYDDYELYFSDRASAEKGLAVLQDCLLESELVLNRSKTEVISLPQPLDYAWAIELRRGAYRLNNPHKQRDELVGLFEHAFKLIKDGVHDHVLRYTLGLTSSVLFSSENWPIYEKLLWQASQIEPSVLPIVMQEILGYWEGSTDPKREFEVDTKLASRVLNSHVLRSLQQSFSHEAVWAIWGLISLGENLEKKVVTACCKSSDSIVAVMMLLAAERGRVPSALVTTAWKEAALVESLVGPQWILAYEAGCRGTKLGQHTAGSTWNDDEIGSIFQKMKEKDVRFTVPSFGYDKEYVREDDYDYSLDDDDSEDDVEDDAEVDF